MKTLCFLLLLAATLVSCEQRSHRILNNPVWVVRSITTNTQGTQAYCVATQQDVPDVFVDGTGLAIGDTLTIK